jgi:hypothetical protein
MTDRWLDCGILKYLFLHRLHVLSLNPASRIIEMGYWNNEVWSWNLTWKRQLSTSDLHQVWLLLSNLEGAELHQQLEDKKVWSKAFCGLFGWQKFF